MSVRRDGSHSIHESLEVRGNALSVFSPLNAQAQGCKNNVHIHKMKVWTSNECVDFGPALCEDGFNRHTSLAVVATKP